MGVGQSKVSNQSGGIIHILVFNDDTARDHYRDIRQPPSDGRPIGVDGSDYGAPIRVGVIHNELAGRYVFDLFRLSNGATLVIQKVTRESGVTRYEPQGGVELLSLGRTIHKAADCPNWALKAQPLPGPPHEETSVVSQAIGHSKSQTEE
ncbi:hypothetical protein ACOMHN_032707 [Nucella lapillus]